MKAALIDLGLGNIASLHRALSHVGFHVEVTSEKESIGKAHVIVIPGVGSFQHGVSSLQKLGIEGFLRDLLSNGRPFLGICFGLHILCENSEESEKSLSGLGLIKGKVKKIEASSDFQVPRIGWSALLESNHSFLKVEPPQDKFYYCHSYQVEVQDEDTMVQYFDYDSQILAAVRKGNLTGFQFHPELSQGAGYHLLESYYDELKRGAYAH